MSKQKRAGSCPIVNSNGLARLLSVNSILPAGFATLTKRRINRFIYAINQVQPDRFIRAERTDAGGCPAVSGHTGTDRGGKQASLSPLAGSMSVSFVSARLTHPLE